MIRATLEELRLSEEEMGPLWRLLPGPEPELTLPPDGDSDLDVGGERADLGAGGAGRRSRLRRESRAASRS